MENYGIKTFATPDEQKARTRLSSMLRESPIPDEQLGSNLGLYLNSKTMARMLFMHHLYTEILNVQGVILDLGCHWGHNAALFSTFRGIYEPFNRHRKIVAFDTFEGFPSIASEDGNSDLMETGNLALPPGYENYLDLVLEQHEADNPINHIKKYEIVKGDACVTVHDYLNQHPETIIALAFFDFDIYGPTKQVLLDIKDRLTKGSIVGFDELNDPDSPGETRAVMEVLGLRNIRLQRYPFASRVSYFVVE